MRILIVEDERAISAFLKASLEAESFAVDIAEDGERGTYLVQTNDYDLMILDNILPKKSGESVCRELRSFGKTLPILILSVRDSSITKADLLNAGADDYLAKPFALEELLARIRALLRRPVGMEADTFRIDDLFLDAKKCIVKRAEREIYLTRKEFGLLHYLMKNEGAVLSRSMILEHVWDLSVDLFSNTIESHILSLRKKIDDMGDDRLIRTIPGRGYKIG